MDLGRKPEEKIRSLMPLAKINQTAVEVRHAVVSSSTSLCFVFFLVLHRAPHFPERVPLSPVMGLLALHPTMLIFTSRARTEATHAGDPAVFSQQMNSDRMRSRWDLSHLLWQVEVLCKCTF